MKEEPDQYARGSGCCVCPDSGDGRAAKGPDGGNTGVILLFILYYLVTEKRAAASEEREWTRYEAAKEEAKGGMAVLSVGYDAGQVHFIPVALVVLALLYSIVLR